MNVEALLGIYHTRFARKKDRSGIIEVGVVNTRFGPRLWVGIERVRMHLWNRIYKLEETVMQCVGNKVKIFRILIMKRK